MKYIDGFSADRDLRKCWPMIWNVRPKVGEIAETNFNSLVDIDVGDKIITGQNSEGHRRGYEVLEIVSAKRSSLKGMQYVIAKTKRIFEK